MEFFGRWRQARPAVTAFTLLRWYFAGSVVELLTSYVRFYSFFYALWVKVTWLFDLSIFSVKYS